MHLPNSVKPKAGAEETFGVVKESTSLAAIVQADGIKPLAPEAKEPLLEQAMTELAKTDPGARYRGITYSLSGDNRLARDWLIQSPDAWGKLAASVSFEPLDCNGCDKDLRLPLCASDADCADRGATCGSLHALSGIPALKGRRVCLGQSDALIDRFYDLVASARAAVDITVLQPPPDYRFLAALRSALVTLARSHRFVTVRILVGEYPPDEVDAKKLLEELVRDAASIRGGRLAIYAGAMRSCGGDPSCGTFSWNHSKIVAVDGMRALVGGHNMWTLDYLLDDPVHDLSMQVEGGAARDAHRFADALWTFVCTPHDGHATVSAFAFRSNRGPIGPGCLDRIALPEVTSTPKNGLPILSVGRLAAGITKDFANQDDLARDLVFGAARQSIYVAQQDIGFSLLGRLDAIFPDATLETWADFMLAGRGDVYVVLSNIDAKGRSKSEYSNFLPLSAVEDEMLRIAELRSSTPRPALVDLLCHHFHLAPFRFGSDATWPQKQAIGNHSKFWMVDGRYFYIGSDNLYPVDLQEFGYIVDDRVAAAEVLRSYWQPLWQWSKAAAISGSDAPRCALEGATTHLAR